MFWQQYGGDDVKASPYLPGSASAQINPLLHLIYNNTKITEVTG